MPKKGLLLGKFASAVRSRCSACDIRMSGKTANATAKTMSGTLTMKSVIDFVGTVRQWAPPPRSHGDEW
jgi:hypothetical protein